MEVLVIVVLIIILLVVFSDYQPGAPSDNREDLLLGPNGLPLAFRRTNNDPPHEDFLHNDIKHRNPHVRVETHTKWFLIFPYTVEVEISEYPLADGTDLIALRQRIDDARQKNRNISVDIIEMDNRGNRDQELRENGEQLLRDVPGNKLTHNAWGKKK